MQIPPITVILSWPPPNYENPETRGDTLLVLLVIFSVLVVLACVGRFYSRIIIKHWFGWDDVFIIIALVFTIAMNAVVILANRRYGWDRHIWDVRYTIIQSANIVAFTAKLLFVGASTFTRISLICFYYRLIKDSGITWFNNVLHASMFFIVGLGIAFTCIGIWLCNPVQSYWIFPPMGTHTCMDEGTATFTIGIFNCVADLLCTLLPIPLVWRLKMPVKHRIGVCFLLGLGFIVTIAGVLRTYFIWESLIDSWDETWYSYPLWICAAIEIDLAVICACAPSLKPILHKPIARLTSKLSSKFSKGSSQRSPMTSHSRTPLPGSSNATKSTKSSMLKRPFTRHGVLPSAQDSVWDGDEEYGMLDLDQSQAEKNRDAFVTAASNSETNLNPAWPIPEPPRPGAADRRPALEIMKQRTVDQQVSYISTQRSSDSKGSATEFMRPNEFDR
ncbi:hypothetical protein Slin15195_G017640 [Septoria linicola]|uniref:Rhodopsin domain-containing protein n=1 Tax=Septoria linicola TaxID=215465 RepID=A0A9Q9AL48_9PEZI|nr:hypothetical protein Slin15195_G017640 [Septoria linicola]